jgi:hypothetical protein
MLVQVMAAAQTPIQGNDGMRHWIRCPDIRSRRKKNNDFAAVAIDSSLAGDLIRMDESP